MGKLPGEEFMGYQVLHRFGCPVSAPLTNKYVVKMCRECGRGPSMPRLRRTTPRFGHIGEVWRPFDT